MLYTIWGVIFGKVTRDYGNGFKVTTFVNETAASCLWPTGVLPVAINDNEAKAA